MGEGGWRVGLEGAGPWKQVEEFFFILYMVLLNGFRLDCLWR